MNRHITLQTPHGSLHGQLELPDFPRGLILLARSHHAAVDTTIAESFAEFGYATFAMELLTAQETRFVDATQNVPRLTQRLIDIIDMIRNDGDMESLPLVLFANGDMAPAAIRAAARRDMQVKALICHGGLIDRAGVEALELLVAPLLMLFEPDDEPGRTACQRAASHLGCVHDIEIREIGGNPAAPIVAWLLKQLGN
jgi:hypothetical protein